MPQRVARILGNIAELVNAPEKGAIDSDVTDRKRLVAGGFPAGEFSVKSPGWCGP